MEAENKDLKARIERQEAFHKRRMEKEKRARAGPAGSSRAPPVGGGIASGELVGLGETAVRGRQGDRSTDKQHVVSGLFQSCTVKTVFDPAAALLPDPAQRRP